MVAVQFLARLTMLQRTIAKDHLSVRLSVRLVNYASAVQVIEIWYALYVREMSIVFWHQI